ncbi:MAG: hypothetical protein L6V93_21995 [Clostridiales bacterium]|nr:MAG: hypothetical protein L6V93_21995 [Clostridiales bacterium]
MFNAKFVYADGREEIKKSRFYKKITIKITVTLKKEEVGENVKYIDITSDMFAAQTGSEGYMIIPSINGTYLLRLRRKERRNIPFRS